MPQTEQEPAKHVSERLLKITGDALMSNDVKSFASVFSLPHSITTFEAVTVLRTLDDVKKMYYNVQRHYHSIGVTDLVRYCVAAAYKSADQIEATHVAHLMQGAHRLAEPATVFSTLERIDGEWMITSSQYAIDNARGHSSAMTLSHDDAPIDELTQHTPLSQTKCGADGGPSQTFRKQTQ
ncbi:MAG: hypothetical protein AB8B51_18550 [Sedimentitalea sp.]